MCFFMFFFIPSIYAPQMRLVNLQFETTLVLRYYTLEFQIIKYTALCVIYIIHTYELRLLFHSCTYYSRFYVLYSISIFQLTGYTKVLIIYISAK